MFSGRGRRVAACTALALSAGMLLSTPASASDTPAPGASVEKQAPTFTPPKLVRPGQDGARAGAQAVTATSPLLSDLDLDGLDDMVFRAGEGIYTTAGAGEEVVLARTEIAKDIIPIGNQAGEAEPEMLVLSENGALTLYADVSPFGTPYEYAVGGGWQAYNKITSPGDVNGDGRADVIARTPAGQLYVYIATGDVAHPLGTRILVGGGWEVYDQLVGLGDGNGDGKADMYARDRSGSLWFYSGTGDKNHPFATRKLIGGGWGAYNQILPAGDGDLWARDSKTGTMYLYTGKGTGVLNTRQQAGDAGDFAGIDQFALAGSIPTTGKDGFLARDTGGTLFWYGPSTTGKVTPRQAISETGEWQGAVWTAISSLNPDNMQDTVQNLDGDLWIDGLYYIGSGWGVYNAFAGPGDLSGDGKGDLLARDRSGVLYLYKGNGEGDKFATRIRVGSGWGGYNKLFGGDYTGDGRADLLARTTGGDLYLYAGTGNATTPFGTRKLIGSGWGTYKHLAAAGDLNADGKGDIVGITSGGDLYTYLNTVPGKFSDRARFGGGFQIYNQIG